MANLIIKPTSGGSLILQDEGGDAALTVNTAGNIQAATTLGVTGNTTLSGSANNIGTVTAGNVDAVSAVVKIASGNFTAVNEIDVQGCFTSSYNVYKLFLMGGAGNSGYRRIGFLNSSNALITSTYYIRNRQEFSASTSGITGWDASSTASSTDQNSSEGFQIDNTWETDGATEAHAEITYFNPLNTTKLQHVIWTASMRAQNYVVYSNGHGVCNSTTAKHGIRIQKSGSTTWTATGSWALYGYRQ